MSHETPGIRWFASELIRFFWRQAIGEVKNYAGWGARLSLAERGRVAAWLASAESQMWWHVLEDVDQSRALAQDAFVEAVEEILELDADPMHVGELRDEDRDLLTEALHVLGILREREREGVPAPRGEAWKHLLESAAEEGEVSREPNMAEKRVERVRQALVDQGYAETYSEVAEAMGVSPSNLSRIVGGYDNTSAERANDAIRKACVHYGVTEGELLDSPPPASEIGPGDPVPEPAPQDADTPREESPSRPESGEGGTDSVSEGQPEAPSVEPEETGSTPGGEGVEFGEPVVADRTDDTSRPQAEDTSRPTIQIEADGQRFVATRNGDGWDLELVARGVDRETANRLHDVAFGLLIDRLEEADAA